MVILFSLFKTEVVTLSSVGVQDPMRVLEVGGFQEIVGR